MVGVKCNNRDREKLLRGWEEVGWGGEFNQVKPKHSNTEERGILETGGYFWLERARVALR